MGNPQGGTHTQTYQPSLGTWQAVSCVSMHTHFSEFPLLIFGKKSNWIQKALAAKTVL